MACRRLKCFSVYKDANGKNLVGLNYVDNVPVYFSQDGIQIKGGFAEDGRYYDKDSGALVTKTFKELLTYIGRDDINGQNIYTTDWYYLDADGRPLKGPQNLGGTNMYFFLMGHKLRDVLLLMDITMTKILVRL